MGWLKGHWQLLALMALVAVLWNTPLIWPLKILVVFFHELAHGIAAVLTGGEIVLITLTPDQGGTAVTRGGSRFAILSAGYLGSLLFGVILFLAALRTQADRFVVAALSVLLFGVALFYLRDRFALAFALSTGLALLAISKWLGAAVNDLVLRIIGLTSMIYVPLDIVSDTITRAHLSSDARMLAEAYGATTVFWGLIWLAVSLMVIGTCLRHTLGANSNITLDRITR